MIRSGCDMNSSRREGPGGEGGEEARDGQAALHLATQWGQEMVVTTLIEHGADIKSQLRFRTHKTDLAMAQLLQHN